MFKQFTPENQNTYEYKAHKSFTLTQADVTRHRFIKDSSNEVSKSYYDFSRVNFYLSGSTDDNYAKQFNIGNDGSGTNSERINKFAIKKQNSIKKYGKVEVYEDLYARNKFEEFFKNIYQKKSLSKKIIEIFKI